MPKRIYVGNLPFNCSETTLRKLFAAYGTVESVNITTGRGGRSQGFGFVELSDPSAAAKAMKALSGYTLSGNRLQLSDRPDRFR